jgi:hypothetical protein
MSIMSYIFFIILYFCNTCILEYNSAFKDDDNEIFTIRQFNNLRAHNSQMVEGGVDGGGIAIYATSKDFP